MRGIARFVARVCATTHPPFGQNKAFRASPAMAGRNSMISYTKLNRDFRNLDRHIFAEKSQCQPSLNIAIRVADTITFAFIGAIGGALLAAVGSLFSSTLLGVAAAIFIGIAIGAYAGKVTGGILGGIYGALAAGLGSLMSGTALGVTVTILACACLAAWCTWTQRDITVARAPQREPERAEPRPARTRSEKMTEIHS